MQRQWSVQPVETSSLLLQVRRSVGIGCVSLSLLVIVIIAIICVIVINYYVSFVIMLTSHHRPPAPRETRKIESPNIHGIGGLLSAG